MSWQWARSVRSHFVWILLLAVILPNAMLAIWIGRAASASARALLEDELQERLASAAWTIGQRWIEMRSPLLTLAEDPRIASALRDPETTTSPRRITGDESDWILPTGVLDRITVLDVDGRVRAELSGLSVSGNNSSGSSPFLPVSLSLYDDKGAQVGTLQARVTLSDLLPPIYGWGAAAGAVPAMFTLEGEPLVTVPMEPLLLRQRQFDWDGADWVAAHRDMHDPPLRLALAAPTAPHSIPFTAAARRGVLGLLVVLSLSVVLTLFLSRSISSPIERLTNAAEGVARGNLETAQLTERGPDELMRLGRAFNSMTVSLRTLIRRVSQQEAAAAVGEFAASLAHEVRNPLTSVRLDLERARERLGPTSNAEDLVERALRQVDRLDATVSGALRIARSGSLDLSLLDLREPLAAVLETVSDSFESSSASLEPWPTPREPLYIRGNATALNQLILNLLLNARDAVERTGESSNDRARSTGRTVRLETTKVREGIVVRVRDDGCGMSSEEQERATEPFYTTRPEGTGLGLTVVKRIAAAHGADLRIESAPGLGTTVTLMFPAVDVPLSIPGSMK